MELYYIQSSCFALENEPQRSSAKYCQQRKRTGLFLMLWMVNVTYFCYLLDVTRTASSNNISWQLICDIHCAHNCAIINSFKTSHLWTLISTGQISLCDFYVLGWLNSWCYLDVGSLKSTMWLLCWNNMQNTILHFTTTQ